MIATKEFEIDTEFGALRGTADIDISGDFPVVKTIGLEEPKDILARLEDMCKDWIEDNNDQFNTVEMREEERDWQQSQDAEAWREERLLGDDQC